MSLIVSGIVVCGALIISVAIYVLSAIGWRVYRNQILLSSPTSNEPIKKIECAMFRRLKLDLITFSYKKGISAADHDQNEEEEGSCDNSTSTCIVCLRDLENEELVRQLPKCKHTFHAPCFDKWLDAHSGCPLCRTPIDRLPRDETMTLTSHSPERNSQEVTVVVDNIRDSMPSVSII